MFDWNILAFDDKEGVGAYHALLPGAVFYLAYSLVQSAKLVCVWFLPHLFEYWVVAQLAPFEALS